MQAWSIPAAFSGEKGWLTISTALLAGIVLVPIPFFGALKEGKNGLIIGVFFVGAALIVFGRTFFGGYGIEPYSIGVLIGVFGISASIGGAISVWKKRT